MTWSKRGPPARVRARHFECSMKTLAASSSVPIKVNTTLDTPGEGCSGETESGVADGSGVSNGEGGRGGAAGGGDGEGNVGWAEEGGTAKSSKKCIAPHRAPRVLCVRRLAAAGISTPSSTNAHIEGSRTDDSPRVAGGFGGEGF
eukprot:7376981-Prymnesium_polylepis.1